MKKTILLVEDEMALQELVSYQLNAEGYQIFAVDNGPDALQLVESKIQPDLVLLDVMLPKMDGFQIANALRAKNATGRTPIIFLTARSTLNDKLTGFDTGAVDYLTKPFKIAELKARVKAHLQLVDAAQQQGRAELDYEMAQAADIQQRLMPRVLPVIPGLDLFARCQPAQQVGGDFFDVTVRSDKQLFFSQADVSGKGLPAALLMSSVLAALWSATNRHTNPVTILEQVNQDFYQKLTDMGKLVTALAGIYNPDTRQIVFANAGHSSVIYCPVNSHPTIIEADGPPLGTLPDLLSELQQISLTPGDLLLIASDGLTEAEAGDGTMFGYDRLLHSVEQLAHLPAEKIGQTLYGQVATFATGQNQFDDQTLLILKGID
jgi:serine phosphatase RsbU (regulator of sigma subunit)